MKFLSLLIIGLLAVTSAAGQTYAELAEKSYDYLEKNDLPAAEESLRAAMRL